VALAVACVGFLMYVVTLSVFHNLAIWLLYVNKPEPEPEPMGVPVKRLALVASAPALYTVPHDDWNYGIVTPFS